MIAKLCSSLFVLALLASPGIAAAENWPQWRGPENNGIAAEGTYPQNVSPAEDSGENLAWKIDLPGRGCSTPIVWGEQIFVTCGIDGQDGVVCYNFEGNELWRQQFGPERPGKHRNGSGSNPSPVTDGKHLVVYYKSGTVACLDLNGNIVWQENLQDKYGADKMWWDLASSPVIAAGNAVIQVLNAGDCYLVALNLADGTEAWKQDRTYETAVESDQGYCSPSVYRHGEKEVIVAGGSDHLTGHDASTGELLWQCGGLNPNNDQMWRMIASPVVDGDAVVLPYARGTRVLKVKLGGTGDVTDTHKLWELEVRDCDVPTPIAGDGLIIVLSGRGHVVCLDSDTSEQLWSADLPKSGADYYCSPVLAGKTLYCGREDGVLFKCDVEDGLIVVAENDLGEQLLATPVPIRGQLLVRTADHLFLFR